MKLAPKLFLLLIFPLSFYAQTGTISGKIKEKATGESMLGVVISIPSIKFNTISDSSGNYILKDVPIGTRDLIFTYYLHPQDTVKDVLVEEGKNTVVDKTSSGNKNTLTEVQVSVFKPSDTDAELIKQIKSNTQIISGISSEQISKGQDRDASEAVKRIPGVAVNNDKFIVVRGLSERYNNVWLNNITAPSSEADKRAFSFDVIPSTLIDQIIVYKSPAADLPGDFAGGMVKVFTKTAPLGHSFIFDMNGFYRPGSTGHTLQFTEGSKTDWMGFDNGFRSIPVGVPDHFDQSNAIITKLFKNTWALHNQKAIPDSRLSFCYSIGFKLKRIQIGSVTGFNYSNQNSLYTIDRSEYQSSEATIVPEDPTSSYRDIQSTNLVRTGAIQNFMIVLNPRNKIELKNLFNQTGKNQSTVRSGLDDDAHVKYFAFGYQQRTLLSSQLEYGHTGKQNKNNYNIAIGYSLNRRNDPDLRRITYQYPPDTMFRSNIPPGSGMLDVTEGATRFYSKLNENIYSLNQSFKRSISIGNYSFAITAGTYLEYKNRVFSSHLYGYTLPVSYLRRQFTALDVSQIFSSQYIDALDTTWGQHKSAGFRIYDASSPSDSYRGQNQLIAPFLSAEIPFLKKFRILAGVRMEDNTQFLQTAVGADSINLKTNTRYFLPSFNLRYDLNQRSLLRFTYGKTLNRPEFRESTPFLYYDFELMALSHGSLFPSIDHPGGLKLKTATIQNFDFRYELYPSATEIITIGVFYKKFTNPIEQVAEAHEHLTGVSRETTFHNSDAAYCLGTEIELRKNLRFFDEQFGTKIFQNLSFIANASLIKSQVYNANDSLLKARPLQGQAPYLANVGLFYGNKSNPKGFQFSITYNVIGPRIILAGGTDGPHTKSGPSIGEMQRHLVDLTLRKNITKYLSFNIGVQDLLNQAVTYVEDANQDGKFNIKSGDKVIMKYKKGCYYTFGIKLQL